jgi:DNA polymerase III subunit epsilon
MNTLTPTPVPRSTPARAATQSPALPVATLLAVALDVPDGGLDHRIDLAALALRPTGQRYAVVGSLHCALHAGMSAALIAEHCRLPLDQVQGRTPVAVALTALECYLTTPPYRVVTHQAAALLSVIARHADACPTLGAAHVVETTALARRVLSEPYPADLHALAAHLGVNSPPRCARTATDAALTGALYAHLNRIDLENAEMNRGAQPGQEVRRAHAA